MRTLLLAAFCTSVLFTGCAPQTVDHVEGRYESISFDFSPYSEKEFLITPQRYDGEYQSIGQITITLWPEADRKRSSDEAAQLGQQRGKTAQGEWLVTQPSTDDLVEAAYTQAKSMGADAIVGFSVSPQTRQPARDLTLTGYKVTGFAIDRQEN